MMHKLESRLLGEISITSDMQMTPPLMAESEEDDHHIPAPRIPVLLGFHITENKLISLSGSQNFARCYWFQDFVLHHGGQIEKDYKTHPNRKRSTSRLYIVTLLI